METFALSVLAFCIPGFVLSCVLLRRNNQVCEYRLTLLKAVSQKAQEDIYAGREWKWRYDQFEAVSYNKMWLNWWEPLESFYDRDRLLGEEPHG